MPSFEAMFLESNGKPTLYKGITISLVDFFPTDASRKVRLVFESCNGEWRQGASLRIREGGRFIINGQKIAHMVLWHDTAPRIVEFELSGKSSAIEVKNVWDTGDGVIESWHNGAAMIVETLSNGRRYRCNDGQPDDDFDDIVFRLERAI